MHSKYTLVIGLEVHAQLLTKSKLFCSDAVSFGLEPNTTVSPISLGHPGTLPKVNKTAIEHAVKMGLACSSQITRYHFFDRKNYFYPDLPKGYQTTQDQAPVCVGGFVKIRLKEGGSRQIPLNRIHLEDDAGKLLHPNDSPYSQIDLNRAGVPLIEIVTEPELKSAEEAGAFLAEVRKLVRYLDICDGNMEEGSLRCDANVSVRLFDSSILGKKVEIKNMNSIRNVQRAIEYERDRQIALLEDGLSVDSETRMFDVSSGETFSLRQKETLNDYRYFAEPDLQPIVVNEEWLNTLQAQMPTLPDVLFEKFTQHYQLPEMDAGVLTETKQMARFFEDVCQITHSYKAVSNWLMGPVRSWINENNGVMQDFPISPDHFASLVELVQSDQVNFSAAAQHIFPTLVKSPQAEPYQIALDLNLIQNSNDDELEVLIEGVLKQMPQKVAEYKSGKKGLIGLFVGEVKKASNGQADPKRTSEILLRTLG